MYFGIFTFQVVRKTLVVLRLYPDGAKRTRAVSFRSINMNGHRFYRMRNRRSHCCVLLRDAILESGVGNVLQHNRGKTNRHEQLPGPRH